MNKHGKKKRRNYWIDIILVDLVAISIISILLLSSSIIYIPDVKGVSWEKVVKNEDKDYNRHILTVSDFSKLYTCKQDKRLYNTKILEFEYDNAQILMKVARAEGGVTLEGQLWSMRTIINRVQSPDFPDTVEEVVSQNDPVQFEVYENGMWKDAELNSNSHLALAMIEGGWDETDGALWFEASSNTENSWQAKNLTFIKEVEGQRYYK